MTTRNITRCDFCQRETEQPDPRWGHLVIGAFSDGAVKVEGSSRDICASCIAKVNGWKGAA